MADVTISPPTKFDIRIKPKTVIVTNGAGSIPPLFFNGKQIASIQFGSTPIKTIQYGSTVIWSG